MSTKGISRYDREFRATLVIASQGTQEPEVATTGYGEMRSRDGANLKFTTNDAKGVHKQWSKDKTVPPEAHICLVNPNKSEVEKAIQTINLLFSEYPNGDTGIDIFFAGHGEYPTGSLVLKDDILTAKELLDLISASADTSQGTRGLWLTLDSCYAGSFLIDIVVELENPDYGIRLFDSRVSSMHDEKSWELSFLEHGAFSFSLLNQGNQYVNSDELTRAIEKNDNAVIAKCLQCMVGTVASCPVAFLTRARQHPIYCLKGYSFSISGLGEFSLADTEEAVTRELLLKGFEIAKNQIWEKD